MKIEIRTEEEILMLSKKCKFPNKKWVSLKDLFAWIGEFDYQTDGICSNKHVLSELARSLKPVTNHTTKSKDNN